MLNVSLDLLSLFLLLTVPDFLKLPVTLSLLLHETFDTIFSCFCINFVKSFDMINLLLYVLLVLFNISLLADAFISHLSIKLKLQQPFSLLSSFRSKLLLLVVKQGIEFNNCIPFVIF
jgi:hypothetical protein